MSNRLPDRRSVENGHSVAPPNKPSPANFTVAGETLVTNAGGGAASLLPAVPGLSGSADGVFEELYTTADLFRDFPDDDVCLEYIKEQIWPKGFAPCPKCGVQRKHYRVSGRKAYACNHCGHHIYPLAGTIFSKSTTPLRTWFYIAYLVLSTRGMVSARQIQRETGVTYKTAWRSRAQIFALLAMDDPQASELNGVAASTLAQNAMELHDREN